MLGFCKPEFRGSYFGKDTVQPCQDHPELVTKYEQLLEAFWSAFAEVKWVKAIWGHFRQAIIRATKV